VVRINQHDRDLDGDLRSYLRHRLRPMSGRDPHERDRTTTPVELLYDLTYVVAFSAAAEQLAHHVVEGPPARAVGAYAFAVFAISWAWLNFTWFASAYGNDDALFRIATIVQMGGVVVLLFGLPISFTAAEHGQNPNNLVMVIGYVVMRVPQVVLWLRAARQDPEHRRVAIAYAVVIAVAQLGWILTIVLPLAVMISISALVVVALAEMIAPVVIESREGRPPWNAGHIAERFNLLTLITLGEVVAATTAAVGALVGEQGWSVAAVVLTASGLILAAALWWAYFLIPARPILERWPERVMAWRYVHLPIFGAIAAVGAGLRVAAAAVDKNNLSLFEIALCLVVPVASVLVTIFVTWSVLMRAYDVTHVPLFIISLAPLAAALAVAAAVGPKPPDLADASQLTGLMVVMALVAAAAIVEVIGHEIVGYRHTVRAVEDADAKTKIMPGGA
jgi:low temperature requirement protein LtrA